MDSTKIDASYKTSQEKRNKMFYAIAVIVLSTMMATLALRGVMSLSKEKVIAGYGQKNRKAHIRYSPASSKERAF